MPESAGVWFSSEYHTFKPYPLLSPVFTHSNVHYMGLTFDNISYTNILKGTFPKTESFNAIYNETLIKMEKYF